MAEKKAGQGKWNQGIACTIISPTRELALQIGKEAQKLVTFHQLTVCTVVGGTSKFEDRKNLWAGVDILVATPGRLIDHLEDRKPGWPMAKWMGTCSTFILDEADAMLELGFQPAIEKVVSFLPKERQTMLFTATVPKKCLEVVNMAVKSDY